jgi:hypothetical protein
MGLAAFGGAPSRGTAVRILYLDESGVGSLDKDPALVVAGVLIHADTQWGAIANRLREILLDAVPFGQPTPSCLHAKDMYHGTKEFHRDHWDKDLRFAMLDKVAVLPEEFGLPVVWSMMDRKAFARKFPALSPEEQTRTAYTVCSVACFMQAELYMRAIESEAEVASIMMEQNAELQRRIPEMFGYLQNPDDTHELLPGWERVMPIRRLIDAPACQPKTASSILQLADFCAFALKRRVEERSHGTRFTAPMVKRLMLLREPKLSSKQTLWNPIVVPSMWDHKIRFDGASFVLADED